MDTTSWRARNRERYNARRRELRRLRRNASLEGRQCLLCEILMVNNGLGTQGLYCKDCNERYALKVARHRWRRYYETIRPKTEQSKFKKIEEMFIKDYMH